MDAMQSLGYVVEEPNPLEELIKSQEDIASEKLDEYKQKISDECWDYIHIFKPRWDDFLKIAEESLKIYQRPKDLYGTPAANRATFIDGSAFETIEWILPSLMQAFGMGDLIKLSPRGPEDVLGASLLEEKANVDLQKNLFRGMYDAFFDAMTSKYGLVKYWWEKEELWKPVIYAGITPEELKILEVNTDLEIESIKLTAEATVVSDEFTGQVAAKAPEYTLRGKKREVYAGARFESTPLDEIIMNPFCKRLAEEPFVCHIVRILKAEVADKYGIEESEIQLMVELSQQDAYRDQRLEDLGGIAFLEDLEDRRYCRLLECYLESWASGKKEKLLVTLLGTNVLRAEPTMYDRPNFCGFTAMRRSHREIGVSLSEVVSDLQKLRTGLIRGILENVAYQNNGVTIYNPNKIDSDDLVSNRIPGGMVRTINGQDPGGAVQPMPVLPLATWIFEIVGMTEQWRQDWTGVTKYTQGSDSSGLNKTATGISAILSQANKKIGLLAQTLGEMGVRDLCEQIVRMNLNFLDRTVNIRLNNEWQSVDPSKLNVAYDLSLDVGSATGSKEMMVQQLMTILKEFSKMNLDLRLQTPTQIYETESELFKAWGFKAIEGKFLVKPPNPEEQPVNQAAGTPAGASAGQPPLALPAGPPGGPPPGPLGPPQAIPPGGEMPMTAPIPEQPGAMMGGMA